MLVWLLIGCFFMMMFVRIGLPIGVKATGKDVGKVALTFRERMLMHRVNMYALGALLILGAVGQWFSTPVEIAFILLSLGIVNLPMCYTFTQEGIACNNVLFRRWKEFEYSRVHGAYLTLMPRDGYAPLKLVVMTSRHRTIPMPQSSCTNGSRFHLPAFCWGWLAFRLAFLRGRAESLLPSCSRSCSHSSITWGSSV